jgi:hypothetical protein
MQRYATAKNSQAAFPFEGQRDKIKFRNRNNQVSEDLGVSNISRLRTQFDNEFLDSYDPLDAFEVDAGNLKGNPDFSSSEGVSLNYDKDLEKRTYNLVDVVNSVTDKPQYGAPNIKVSKEATIDPNRNRDPNVLGKRSTAYGIRYRTNFNNNAGVEAKEDMRKYITSGESIHNGGSINRLGIANPSGESYNIVDN